MSSNQIKSDFICTAQNNNLESPHWALTDCTVVTSSALRPSNQVEEKLKNPKQGK